jgi:hypothetical protein
MAGKLDNVRDEKLRTRLDEARQHLGARRPTEAVHVVADVFLGMLRERPDLLTKTIQLPNGMRIPMLMRWPMLGANLAPDSVKAGEPRIEYIRERFALSEAITYYEFTVDTALAEHF